MFVQFILFFGFSENDSFFGYENFVDIFGGHHKIGLYLRVISMHLGSFLKANIQNGGYFWGFLKFQFYLFIYFFFLGGGGA